MEQLTSPTKVEVAINRIRETVSFLANDILNSSISPFIRISELITMLMKNVEVIRGLSGAEKRQVVIQLGYQMIVQYAPEVDRDILEGMFNQDARDLIELIVSASRIVNHGGLRRLLACLPCFT